LFRYHWSKLWPYPLKTDGHYCMKILFKWQKNIMLFFLLQKRFFFFFFFFICFFFFFFFFIVHIYIKTWECAHCTHSWFVCEVLSSILTCPLYSDCILSIPIYVESGFFFIPIVTYTVHSNLSWIFFFIPIVIYLVHSNVIISCHFRQ
jgi:hypothetical protein